MRRGAFRLLPIRTRPRYNAGVNSTPSRLERTASLVLQLGALLVVLVVLPYRTFELDRFFVPKELVLHGTAAVVLVLLLDRATRRHVGFIGWLLAAFLVASAASAALATNHWLATRALAVSFSGIALFWGGRAIAQAGAGRRLLAGLSAAVVVGALTGLAQAYGVMGEVMSDFLSLARAPGGTFGNRNFLAHLCAIGIPSVIFLGLTSSRKVGVLFSAAALTVLSAALLLSRTRAAWLALMVAAALLLPATAWRWPVIRGSVIPARGFVFAACIALGVTGALLMPNRLSWVSDNPYLESATGVVNYREGSGRGRLVQYENSLDMALANPLLGVGPGNWAVAYPKYASRNDPSLGAEGMTMNPWPSSDWMAFVSERGLAATLALVAAFLGLFAAGATALVRARAAEEAAAALALCGTVIVTVIVAGFDAVLLLPAPALVTWPLLGALWVTCTRPSRPVPMVEMLPEPVPHRPNHAMMAAVGVIGAVLLLRSAAMALAMGMADGTRSPSRLQRAASADPGSYRIRVATAQALARRGRCREALPHARAARAQFPNAPAPRRVLERCS